MALPIKTVERLLRKAGAKRVSKGASEEFARYLEKLAGEIASEAAELAKHSGRQTVTEQDVLMVRKIRRSAH